VEIGAVFVPHDGRAVVDARWAEPVALPSLASLAVSCAAQFTEAGIARFRERRPEVVLDTME
jgi:hypothetical protein